MPRWVEIMLVLVGFLVILPLALLSGSAVFLSMGKPIFFRQKRVGKGGESFEILKFRTMTNAKDSNGELLPDNARITKTGAWLRRFRFDELPSFLHVLSGELALVGPRPLLPQFYEGHPERRLRLQLRPGFTGLSQVSGNTLLSDSEKLSLDCLYIAERSFFLDCNILLKTVHTLVVGEKRNEPLIRRALSLRITER